MLHAFHNKADATRWLVGLSILTGGWLEFLLWHVVNPPTLAAMRTYTVILPTLGLGFIGSAWSLKTSKFRDYSGPAIKMIALVSSVLGTVAIIVLPREVSLVALIVAAYPILYDWFRRIPTMSGSRRHMFVLAWLGSLAVALILGLGSQWVGMLGSSAVGLLFMTMVYLRVPNGLPSKKFSSDIKIPKKLLGLGFGIFFVLGMGLATTVQDAVHGVLSAHSSLIGGVSWSLAFIGATAAIPLVLRKNTRWLVYTGCSTVVAALLCRIEVPHGMDIGYLLAILSIGAWVLVLWWLSILFGFLRHGPRVLGVGLGIITMAISTPWVLVSRIPQMAPGWLVAASVLGLALLLPFASVRAATTTRTDKRVLGPTLHPESFYVEAKLTQQERKIVDLLLAGSNNQDILGTLYISINTLKTHLRNIYRKTDTSNRHELIDVIAQYHVYSAGE